MDTVQLTRFEAKSYDTPDETVQREKTQIDLLHLEAFTFGRFTFQPGWRWSECIKPVAKKDSCPDAHTGYAVSGRLRVRLDDGREMTIHGGESFSIPSGHDAWVEGDLPYVMIEVMSADEA